MSAADLRSAFILGDRRRDGFEVRADVLEDRLAQLRAMARLSGSRGLATQARALVSEIESAIARLGEPADRLRETLDSQSKGAKRLSFRLGDTGSRREFVRSSRKASGILREERAA